MPCIICNNPTAELREGVCWHCAEAESIINDGTDMYDKGPGISSTPAKTSLQRLKFLVERGWMYNCNPAKDKRNDKQ